VTRRLLAALLLLLGVGVSACRMTPDEIRAIETENELLREQIQALKERCEQTRELDVRPEQVGEHERR
jgi:hypothetical protein